MTILETRDLKKYYGSGDTQVKALDGVDLSIQQGEFVAIVGTSGSGKSTLLHMLGGLDRPTSGTVTVDGKDYAVTAVSMGNPHAVVFMDGIDALDLPVIGPKFENHPLFPQRTNTEFVEVVNEARVRMRVWERGTGETLACGTGACAVAVASFLNGRTGRIVEVELRGGLLRIKWDETDGHVYMTGPAATVYDGTFYL